MPATEVGLGRPGLIYRSLLYDRVGYHPSPSQQQFHSSKARHKLLAGGERAGKSLTGAMELLAWMPLGSLWWIVGPSYELARPEAVYIIAALDKLGESYSLSQPQQGPIAIIWRGVRVLTRSAQDPETLAGTAPDGILMAEAAQQPLESYLRCQARVMESRGPLWLTGTFEGSLGWYPSLWREWRDDDGDGASFSLPTWANVALFPLGYDDPEIQRLKALYAPDRFQERLGGEPCPPVGRVLAEMTTAHIVPHELDRTLPVYVWIDPGYAGAYAVEVAQVVADRVRLVDEVYLQGCTTDQVLAACQARSWWPLIEGGAIDVAGRQHHAEASAIERWREAGIRVLVNQQVDSRAGLDTLRSFLAADADGVPRLTVSPRCRGFLAEAGLREPPFPNLGVWRYKVDSAGDIVSDSPEDRCNHGAKAAIYGLVARFGYAGRPRKRLEGTYVA